jgi:hypothetical protein
VLYANRESAADSFPAASSAAMEALVGGAPDDFLFEVRTVGRRRSNPR